MPNGQDTATDVSITNNSATLAFLVRVDVRRGSGSTPDANDNQVRPATYSDNYITLWPGQSQEITETYDSSLLHGKDPVVSVGGFNVDTVNLPATPVAAPGIRCGGPGGLRPRQRGARQLEPLTRPTITTPQLPAPVARRGT